MECCAFANRKCGQHAATRLRVLDKTGKPPSGYEFPRGGLSLQHPLMGAMQRPLWTANIDAGSVPTCEQAREQLSEGKDGEVRISWW
jgi:hypothetical protein